MTGLDVKFSNYNVINFNLERFLAKIGVKSYILCNIKFRLC